MCPMNTHTHTYTRTALPAGHTKHSHAHSAHKNIFLSTRVYHTPRTCTRTRAHAHTRTSTGVQHTLDKTPRSPARGYFPCALVLDRLYIPR